MTRHQRSSILPEEPSVPLGLAHRVSYWLFRALLVPYRVLPRPWLRGLAHLVGLACYVLCIRRRRIARANLDIVFGEEKSPAEKRRILRRFFVNFALVVADFQLAARLNHDNFQKYVTIDEESMDQVRQSFDRGHGAVGVFFHFGNWEVMGAAYGLLDLPPLTFIAQRLANPLIDQYLNRIRAKHGNRLAYRDEVAAHILPALGRDEAIGIVVDRNTYEGVDIELFGLTARTTPAPALLAVKFGCPLVPAVCYPEKGGRYRIVFGPILEARRSGNQEEEVYELTRALNAILEERIRRNPELWLWGHRRWKCRPTRERGPYPFYSQYVEPRPLYTGSDKIEPVALAFDRD